MYKFKTVALPLS